MARGGRLKQLSFIVMGQALDLELLGVKIQVLLSRLFCQAV